MKWGDAMEMESQDPLRVYRRRTLHLKEVILKTVKSRWNRQGEKQFLKGMWQNVFHVELVQIESSIVPLETWISTLLTEVWNWTIKSPFWKLAFIPPTVYLWQQHCDCCCSVAKSCPTLDPGTAAHQSLLSFTVSQSLPKFMSIELVMISKYLILCHPLLLLPRIFPNTGIFSNKSVHRIRWPKYWCFSFSISPSNEYSGLISFRIDWFDLLGIQGSLKNLLQHHDLKVSIIWCSASFMV